ncbi:PfkB family carbohydrate kinase [Bacteroidota bacterium]
MKKKIIPFKEIESVVNEHRKLGDKIVQCHGVFDLIHPGHIKHFEAAKKFGNILVVSITEDKHVNKGPGRPIFDEKLRAENIAAIQYVDYVIINKFPTAITAIEKIKPDFYVKGQDYKNSDDDFSGGIIDERNKVEAYGGQIVFTEEIQFSSSKLINRHLDFKDEEIKEYLENIRKLTSFEKLKSDFDKIADYNVLILGDIILDEYQFVAPLGKASKSNSITAKRLDCELYGGGVLAVANHISNFVKKVTLISTFGNNFGKNYETFIKKNLNKNVTLKSIYTADRPTTLKKRYIDNVFKHKLFEINEIDDSPLPKESKNGIINFINEELGNNDLFVVADFGHGLIDAEIVEHITGKDIFLSVNAQTNSANKGYNLLTKYPKCNYFSIDENEARLATHDKFSDMNMLFENLLKKTGADSGAITLGTKGSLVGSMKISQFVKAPVLSGEVIDTIGAGDAFLSITTLMAKNNNSLEEIAFVGNAVGAMAVKILGNKSYIEKVPLLKYLKTLLT